MLSGARKFEALGAAPGKARIDSVEPVEEQTRELQSEEMRGGEDGQVKEAIENE